jgi:MbtH protein
MANPFEEGEFVVLTNAEGQHSLWPTTIDVPVGWTNVHGPGSREECVEFINKNWVDMRPASLAKSMARTTN